MKTKVILLKDEKTLGKRNSIVEVAHNYAELVLVPKGIAVFATKENLNVLKGKEEKEARELEEKLSRSNQLIEMLNDIEGKGGITLKMKGNSLGKMLGSVTSKMIADELTKYDIQIKKQDITIDIPMKSFGMYPVKIKLFGGKNFTLNVAVVAA